MVRTSRRPILATRSRSHRTATMLAALGTVVLATSSCTVPIPGVPIPGVPTPGVPQAPQPPAVPPDAQVVGEWMVGSGAGSWVDSAGNTQFSSGSGEFLTINADGTYSDATLINIAPYLDGYFFKDDGAATTNGTELTLSASQRSGLHRAPSRSDWQLGEPAAQPATRTFTWRIDAEEGYLCLTPLDQSNGEVCYGRLR